MSDAAADAAASSSVARPEAFYRALINQVGRVGWHCTRAYDDRAATLTLVAEDAQRREHVLTLQLPADFPAGVMVASAQLPEVFMSECVVCLRCSCAACRVTHALPRADESSPRHPSVTCTPSSVL